MSTCSFDDVDALAFGELAEAREAGVRAHVERCGMCSLQLRRLRAERSLLAERSPAPDVERLFGAVQVRIAQRGRVSRERRRMAGALAAAALVAVIGLAPRLLGSGDRDQVLMSRLDPFAVCVGDEHAVSRVESSYGACLVATPRSLPDALGLCL